MKSNLNPDTPLDDASFLSSLKGIVKDSVDRLTEWAGDITTGTDGLTPQQALYHRSELNLQEEVTTAIRSVLGRRVN